MSACINTSTSNSYFLSILIFKISHKKFIQCIPCIRQCRISHNNSIINSPTFFSWSPSNNFNFKPVILNVYTSSQYRNFIRYFNIIYRTIFFVYVFSIILSSRLYFFKIKSFNLFFKTFSESCINKYLHKLFIAFGFFKFLNNTFPF